VYWPDEGRRGASQKAAWLADLKRCQAETRRAAGWSDDRLARTTHHDKVRGGSLSLSLSLSLGGFVSTVGAPCLRARAHGAPMWRPRRARLLR
jgi:hypothetical protein